ncbi:helix-turn-helix domain-containing protein [Lonepinella sp. BR2474]|uniref:helix-turn-helix domain-containing protein n=1 Tax=Lonepinella sp. BR2474 TaxID=3434548 RepID=UPI003F6DB682
MKTLDDLLATFTPEEQKEIQQEAEELILEARLSNLREELEMSQKELAKSLGISQPAVAQIEQRGNELKLSTLKRYVETLGGRLSLAVDMPTGKCHIYRI